MDQMFITAIVLSAGKGSRMGSSLPKSLHPVAGQPILARILIALKGAQVDEIRVVINKEHKNLIQPVAEAFKARVFFQNKKIGTASAVISAEVSELKGAVLIINGDHPLISAKDIENFVKIFKETLGRPVFMKAPPGFLKLMLGEMSGLLLDSTRVVPELAQKKGFVFEYSELESALKNLF